MFVRDYMTRNLITVDKKTGIFEALEIMKKHKIRQLPVVSAEGHLEGLVTEKELLTVSPSPATSLSIYELNYLLAKMTVAEAMVKNPLTVTTDTTLEEAALLMREHKIGSVPVMEGGRIAGIITVTDIFDALVKFFGYGKAGTRLVIESRDRVGLLADVTQVVKEFGILILGIISNAKENGNVEIMLRLNTGDPAPLAAALESRGFKVTYIN
ncbi:FOG: CBS domain [Pelotomaculum thermopropionicum SI]|uniref:FOG: CBS domain n=1 Tax=Pelotomaculum thermopropionicum (strain DSM 13744 / JCM 10971 / SI) TaxID=370438 RepID=A5D0B8_PELTS|nr:FOG: CBS domain [Pelotomaculum thermopropionicum SI]